MLDGGMQSDFGRRIPQI